MSSAARSATPPSHLPERGRGRPPVESRATRLAMLYDGAYALLHAGDYGAFTIEAVARSAGMARKTVYTLVASKEELMHGLIQREGAKLDALLHGDVATEEGVLGELRAYLTMWARLALGPVGLGIYLMAVAHRETSPAIARSYDGLGMSHAVGVLRAWLAKPAVGRVFAIDDTEAALKLVSAVLIAQPLRGAALGVAPVLDDEAIDAIVAATLDIFVRCYALPGKGVASNARPLGRSAP
ncbi:TetR/AcrR family transcriptional regulator [Massilia sp. S19_KUP03_FR1]|uniref:TetR/AcrR family transcriptional regulator n=1 Tax=Massilia sp. S19_KUP03_FR1 TaxID=3025503 RepID=UPI002FCDB048